MQSLLLALAAKLLPLFLRELFGLVERRQDEREDDRANQNLGRAEAEIEGRKVVQEIADDQDKVSSRADRGVSGLLDRLRKKTG